MLKHTPGPWYYANLEIMSNHRVIADMRILGPATNSDPEGLANARLIAVAPEMLDALIRIYPDVSEEVEDEAGVCLRDIIEQATGLPIEEVKP